MMLMMTMTIRFEFRTMYLRRMKLYIVKKQSKHKLRVIGILVTPIIIFNTNDIDLSRFT